MLEKKLTFPKLLVAGIIILAGLAVSPKFNGDYQTQSLSLVQPAIAQESANDHFLQGFHVLRENPDQAIPLFTRAIQLDPNHANAYFFRGIAYSFKKQYEPAFRDIGKAISLSPNNPSYYITRGKIYEKIGDHRRAQQDLQQAKAITESLKRGESPRALEPQPEATPATPPPKGRSKSVTKGATSKAPQKGTPPSGTKGGEELPPPPPMPD
jgi:tetratricopeptide (TPR) repeat protein